MKPLLTTPLLCLALIVHALVARYARPDEAVELRRASLGVHMVYEFLTMFIVLLISLPLIAWYLWIGDRDHWFFHNAWIFAGIAATICPAMMLLRFRKHSLTKRYMKIHFWIPFVLLAWLTAILAQDVIWGI